MADDDFLKLLEDSLFGLSEPAPATATPAAKPRKSASEIRGAPVGGGSAVSAAPASAPDSAPASSARPVLLHVGSDFETRAFFNSTFGADVELRNTADLAEVKRALTANEVRLLVFDPSSAVKPGVAITRYVKEKGLPATVVHVCSAQTDDSEEYAKYKLYHLHLQPDFRVRVSELATISAPLRKVLAAA